MQYTKLNINCPFSEVIPWNRSDINGDCTLNATNVAVEMFRGRECFIATDTNQWKIGCVTEDFSVTVIVLARHTASVIPVRCPSVI